MGVVVLMIRHEYLATAYRIDVMDCGLLIAYPANKRTIAYSDISSIKMPDSFQKGARHPEVWVIVQNDRKPYKLKQLGVDANTLFLTLKKAKDTKT
ncbi:hypothetical protein [uncultured Desulfobacter sp.]|uniref:hypothetical protein n=1 Tax=uncultured Desulfobacter sp. TaxID=240139 RepID=UPI002AAAACAB|nr:hypothetical protein [uncultured Desulfobacter sp.]